jgi:flagellar motor switch protein FliG
MNIAELSVIRYRSAAYKPKEESRRRLKIINSLHSVAADALFRAIKTENPERIAAIFAYIEAGKAATILRELPLDGQIAVIHAIAKIEHTKTENPRSIEKFLKRKTIFKDEDGTDRGGIEQVVGILNLTNRDTETQIINKLQDDAPAFADQILKRMVVFEDIVMLSDEDIQKALTETDARVLSVALKGVDSVIQEKLFSNMSVAAAQEIKDNMDYMGPVRMIDVEEAQFKIVKLIRSIYLQNGGHDESIL